MGFLHAQKYVLLGLLLGANALVVAHAAEESESPVANCLKAWGNHPFGKDPEYRTLGTSVKVFGIGRDAADTETTASPALVLINPGVNVAGGSVMQLLNPKGWYCLRTTVSVMGGLTIRAHCKAHLATTSGDVLGAGDAVAKEVIGEKTDKGVTVLGSTQVERVGCD